MAQKNLHMIKVFVRQRPPNEHDQGNIVHYISDQEVTLKSRYDRTEKKFSYDHVFAADSSQEDVYDIVVRPLIRYVVDGYNCTAFAYGQTGTGKTFTMLGDCFSQVKINLEGDPRAGMVPRAATHLFSELNKLYPKIEYTVMISFTEIYNEEVRDLFVPDSEQLRVFEDPENRGSIRIKDLKEVHVLNAGEVYEWLNMGVMERQTAATNLNRSSSRSHTIFTMQVHIRETIGDQEVMKTAKLNLVDLAGSENIGRSGATEMRAREAGKINQSLLTLGKVIKASSQKSGHVPYRDSKLTRILQDSLGGKTKTCMVATFSSCSSSWEETVSTLEYAQMARSVANTIVVNIDRKQNNVLSGLKAKINSLRQELDAARTGVGFYISHDGYKNFMQEIESKSSRVHYMMQEIQMLEEYKATITQKLKAKEAAFQSTKNYLDSQSQRLHETQQAIQQQDRIIMELEKQNSELRDTQDLLVDIYETSNKHGDVYHKKYEVQCDTTLANADVAKNVSSILQGSLAVGRKYSHLVKTQEEEISRLQESSRSISNSTISYLNELSSVSSEFESRRDKLNPITDSIMINATSEDEFRGNTHSLLDSHCKIQSEKSLELKALVGLMTAHVADFDTHIKTAVEVTSLEDPGCSLVTHRLNKLKLNCFELLSKRQEQADQNRQLSSLFNDVMKKMSSLDEMEQQELNLTTIAEEIANLESSREKIKHILKKVLALKSKLLDNQKEFRASLDQPTKFAYSLKTFISKDAAVTEYKNALLDCSTKHVASLKAGMEIYNNEFNAKQNSWAQCLSSLGCSSQECIAKHSEEINKMATSVNDLAIKHNSVIKQRMIKSSEEIEYLSRYAVPRAHEGDTPIKQSYKLPVIIKPHFDITEEEDENPSTESASQVQ